MKVSLGLWIPTDLTADGKSRETTKTRLTIETVFTLRAGQRYLECRTHFSNQAKRHRVKLMFPTHFDCGAWFGDTAYDLVQRNVQLLDTTGWIQKDQAERPIKNMVAACGAQSGLAIFTKGLNEACVQDNEQRTIALTLFRSFYQNLESEGVEGGLLLGDIITEYAIAPFTPENGRPPAALFSKVEQYKLPVQAITQPVHAGYLTTEGRLLDVEAPFVLSTIKVSEDESGVIVRVLNPLEEEVTVKIRCNLAVGRVWRTDLEENLLQLLAGAADGSVALSLRGKEIGTVLFERR